METNPLSALILLLIYVTFRPVILIVNYILCDEIALSQYRVNFQITSVSIALTFKSLFINFACSKIKLNFCKFFVNSNC